MMRSWILLPLLGLMAGCALGPQTYSNEFISNNPQERPYQRVAFETRGYFADQLVLATRDKMPAVVPGEGAADITVFVDSRLQVMQRSRKSMSPVVSTLTLQVVRNHDQEVIYSLVKQYEIVISTKKGKVSVATKGWVDMAASELAEGVAEALALGGAS